MKSREQKAENKRQIVFEPEFDPEVLRLNIEIVEKGGFKLSFYESGSWAHSSKKFFEYPVDAFNYGEEVIARYEGLIEAAELAFILGDDRSDLLGQFEHPELLDADFVKIVRAADEGGEEGAG